MRAILTPRMVAGGALALALGALAACGSGGSGTAGSEGPHVVVTTSVLGDVVENVVGDEATVEVLMPPGADPHEASLSARQADAMVDADLVVVNGAGFEQGMASVLESVEADGAPVFAVADHVELMTFADHHAAGHDEAHDEPGHDDEAHDDGADDERHDEPGHDDEAHDNGADDERHDEGGDEGGDDDHGEEGHHDDGHGHDEDDLDPHFWTDPTRMVPATEALADRVAGIDGVDAAAVERNAAAYVAELEALDAEMADLLAAVPDDRRTLVTNHEVFGYFARRFGFEVAGTVIPAGTTQAEPSSSEVDALADTIAEAGVPAIFVETSAASSLADGLAESGDGVEVVELFSESLGEEGSGGETYLDMMRTNAERIAEALA